MVTESDAPLEDELFLDEWDLEDDDLEDLEPPLWRKPLVIAVAAITVIAMALVPLYNLIDQGRLPIADNGLEVCGFDYCVIQDGVRAAGMDLVMSRFANTYLDEAAAAQVADALVRHLDIPPINLEVVERLDGQLEGQYSPATRTILIERPARAWIVLHEVAHAVAPGHGDEFQRTLVELAIWLDSTLVG